MHAHVRMSRRRTRARQNICARVFDSYVGVRARILKKKTLVVESYLINLCFKFRKDPTFRGGDFPLFVTMYDLEQKILSFSKPPKNAILSAKKRTLRITFFKKIFDNNIQKSFI